jgi:hypothetical protein
MISVPYAPGYAAGLRWNDPTLGIRWPMTPTVISTRDAGTLARLTVHAQAARALMARRVVVVSGAGSFIGRWSVPRLPSRAATKCTRSQGAPGRGLPAQLSGAEIHYVDLLQEGWSRP